MTNGKDTKPSSVWRRAMRYLIGCIAILLLFGLIIAYWPVALAIAVIGGIAWWASKSKKKQETNKTIASVQPTGNTPQSTKLSPPPQPTVAPSVPTPVVTIEYSANRSTSRSTTPGTNAVNWASYEDVLDVATYRIEHPMTYWASGKTDIDEASCIEKQLPVSKPISEPKGALGYWPRYVNMTPGQRGNYLHWLATGKQEQLQDIGYAFLYFYGLERRVLIDGKDVNLILPEVVRLLSRYPESGSFNGYLSRFITFAAARTGLESMTRDVFTLCFVQARRNGYSEDLLAVILCWFYQHNLPLSANWAFEVARLDVRTTRSVVVDRAPEEFMSLFMQKYREQFGDGMMLKVAVRERLLGYHPASPSLLELHYSYAVLEPVRIPDVLGIRSQFKQLVQIWSECIKELRAYSRVVSKGVDITTREAYEALPPELSKNMDHPDAPRWEEVAKTHARDDGFSLAPLAKLAEIQGFEQRKRLTPTQSRELARTAEDIGLAIVPDARVTGRVYAWTDEVVLFRQENRAAVQEDSGYHAAACMLELGMVIAGADGTFDREEIARIEQYLDDQFRLSSDESRHLKAYGLFLIKNPISVSSLSKPLLAALSKDERALVGKYLVGVAAANGTIDRKEISALKRTYAALEIDVSLLDSLLAELHQSGSKPVEVQTGQRDTRAGEAIPIRKHPPDSIPIDYDAVARIRKETEEVSRILGQVLCETKEEVDETDKVERENPPVAPDDINQATHAKLPFSDEQLSTLNKRYHAPLAELLRRQVWSSDEIAVLAKENQTMPSGMLDAINAWADETLGDILVEDGNDFEINQSLVEA